MKNKLFQKWVISFSVVYASVFVIHLRVLRPPAGMVVSLFDWIRVIAIYMAVLLISAIPVGTFIWLVWWAVEALIKKTRKISK